MPVTATETGFKKMEAKITKLSISKMADIVVNTYKSNFRSSLNADGTAMSPISPERIAYKKRIGARFPRRPLVFTEQLMNASEKRRLNKHHYQVSVRDKLRSGGITNTGILNIHKKASRWPWGIGKTLIKNLRDYVGSVLGGQ